MRELEKRILKLLRKYDGDIPRHEFNDFLKVDILEEINTAFDCNIKRKKRDLKYIKGRALYCGIMRLKGRGVTEIAEKLHLNHATIYNCFKSHDKLMICNVEYRLIAEKIIEKQIFMINAKTPNEIVRSELRKQPSHYLWNIERSKWTETDYYNLNNRKSNKAVYPAVKLIDTVTGVIYPSTKNASEKIGMGREKLREMIHGRRKNTTTLKIYHKPE